MRSRQCVQLQLELSFYSRASRSLRASDAALTELVQAEVEALQTVVPLVGSSKYLFWLAYCFLVCSESLAQVNWSSGEIVPWLAALIGFEGLEIFGQSSGLE